jgi:hypothetical protein
VVLFRWSQKLLLAVGVALMLLLLLLVVFQNRQHHHHHDELLLLSSSSSLLLSSTTTGLSSSTIVPNNNNKSASSHQRKQKTRQEEKGWSMKKKKKKKKKKFATAAILHHKTGPSQEEEGKTVVVEVVDPTKAAATPNNNNSSSSSTTIDDDEDESCRGKERLVQIVMDATGMSRKEIVTSSNASYYCRDLPTWQQVVDLYGAQPIIVRHLCSRRRRRQGRKRQSQSPRPRQPLQPRVAGLYNTGTNALVKLLPLNLPQSMWAVVPPDAAEQQDEDNTEDTDNKKKNVTNDQDAQNNNNNNLKTNRKKKKKKKTGTYFDWDVPWGKHNPPNTFYKRDNLYMPGQANVSIHDILPVIVVKDPYWWMQSTCSNRYGVQFSQQQQQSETRCPNLISSLENSTLQPVPISVHRTVRRREYVQDYDSLLHLWTDFYSQYLVAATTMMPDKKDNDNKHDNNNNNNNNVDNTNDNGRESSNTSNKTTVVDFPFVMVRFEDLLFHAPAVLQAIADCANGGNDDDDADHSDSDAAVFNTSSSTSNKKSFSYYLPKSKSHGKTSTDGFISAMMKYGTTRGRTDGMSALDLQFARQHLLQQPQPHGQQPMTTDRNLMHIFHYQTA